VRHPLVQRIIVAYEKRDAAIAQKRKEQKERRAATNSDEPMTSGDEKEKPS
jgi:hypothetical protein